MARPSRRLLYECTSGTHGPRRGPSREPERRHPSGHGSVRCVCMQHGWDVDGRSVDTRRLTSFTLTMYISCPCEICIFAFRCYIEYILRPVRGTVSRYGTGMAYACSIVGPNSSMNFSLHGTDTAHARDTHTAQACAWEHQALSALAEGLTRKLRCW